MAKPISSLEIWAEKVKYRPLQIVIAGQGGYGKSAVINSLLGFKEGEGAQEGQTGAAMTTAVNPYENTKNGIKVKLFDSPGLCDPDLPKEKTLKEIGEKTGGKVDLLYYCVNLRIARINEGDVEAFKLLTVLFGTVLWEKTVFVLTFANEACKKRNFPSTVSTLTEKISLYLKQAKVGREAGSISVTVAGYKENVLTYYDGTKKNWKDDLLVESVRRAPPEAVPGLLRICLSDKQWKIVLDGQVKEWEDGNYWGRFGLAVGGAVGGLGGTFFGPVGIGVGAVGGSAIGKEVVQKVAMWWSQREFNELYPILKLKHEIWMAQQKQQK